MSLHPFRMGLGALVPLFNLIVSYLVVNDVSMTEELGWR